MAISANRSQSPSPSPSPTLNPHSRPNRNLRNSENSPMRRSFTENPFQRPSIQTNPRSSFSATPANSPADFLSRNNLATEEKENEKENHTLIKPTKARSPAVSKGTNHFMIPTISAASKINPSPRKKALADRNEPIRTSLTFSYNTQDFDKKSDEGFNEKASEIEYLETPSKPNLSQKQPSPIPLLTPTTFSKSPNVKKVTFSPNIALLDADPSLPPYDPKTNYLSPRPQFLHYKPNPRLELSSETKSLEDKFLSESLSDTEESDVITDISEKECKNASPVEVITVDSQKRSEVITEISEKECKNASPVEIITVDSQKESEVITEISEKERKNASQEEVITEGEPEPITTPIRTNFSKVSNEGKRVAKSQFLTKGKLISLILVILLACFSGCLINSPLLDTPMYENLSSSKFYEEGFNDLARNLKMWSVRYTYYVNELVSSFNGVEKLGPLQFYNLTYTMEDPFKDVKRFEEIYDQDEEEAPVFEDEDELESPLDQNLENEVDSEELGEDQHISDSEIDSVSSFGNTFEIEISEVQSSEHLVSAMEIESTVAVPSFGNTLGKDTSDADVETKQDSPVVPEFETEATKLESDLENTSETDAYTSDLTPEYKSTEQYKTLAMSLLSLALIAAASVLIYIKNKNANTKKSTVVSEPITNNLDPQSYSPPSEMSSFDDKSYSYTKRETTNEIQSRERKQKRVLKRESLASSTDFSMTDSPSYGSFTTYERLPIKHGYGDDEVVTPVRRSSRIKKIQVTPS